MHLRLAVVAVGLAAGELAVVVQADPLDFGATLGDVGDFLLVGTHELEGVEDLQIKSCGLILRNRADVRHFVAIGLVLAQETFREQLLAAHVLLGEAFEFKLGGVQPKLKVLTLLYGVAFAPLLEGELGEGEVKLGLAQPARVVVDLNLQLVLGGDQFGPRAGEARGFFVDLSLQRVGVELHEQVALLDARAFGDDVLDRGLLFQRAANFDLVAGLEIAVGDGADLKGLLLGLGEIRRALGLAG